MRRLKLVDVVTHQIDVNPGLFHQGLADTPHQQVIDRDLGTVALVEPSPVGHQAIDVVFRCQIKMGDGLLGFGQPATDGTPGCRQGNNLHPVRPITSGSGANVIIGDPATTTGSGYSAEVNTQFVRQPAYRR